MKITRQCLKYISQISINRPWQNIASVSSSFCGRRMYSDHLERTASNTRHEVVSGATVVKVEDESPTVKKLTLKVHDRRLSFKAGQWVDMVIPDVSKVGGFSMCSSPRQLVQDCLLDLAVKRSDHPPALWVHTQCREGKEVSIRSGGDTFYDPKPDDPSSDLLLIAGGIGINPLYSILCHVTDMLQSKGDHLETGADNSVYTPGRVCLLYSASSEDELIFQKQLSEAADQFPGVECQYFVTRKHTECPSPHVKYRRIDPEDIHESLKKLRKENTLVYICGPSPMIETMETILLNSGIDPSQILYEKWW